MTFSIAAPVKKVRIFPGTNFGAMLETLLVWIFDVVSSNYAQ